MPKLLDKINSPADIKEFTIEELITLAEEVREFIIDTVLHKTGGHLASNLGAVELTIALHYVFDIPADSLIFDVSHQCYTHKILTGRKDKFHTIRTLDGLSGFTNKEESDYDVFTAGHAGTSISTALGISTGNSLMKKDGKAIAFVGDASIGAGMCFEAMNHSGHMDNDLIIILNDNQMSIGQPVGSLSKYLDKIRYTSFYKEIKKDVEFIATKLPLFGDKFGKMMHHLKKTIHNFTDTAGLFEELNISYHGPSNGHNIAELIHQLEEIKKLDGPILFHVLTEKGRGFEKAEIDPKSYHGVSPKKKETNFVELEPEKATINFTNHFSSSLIELAEKYKEMVAITAAMDRGTGLEKFKEEYPERFFDVGICEQHAIGLAAGLEASGCLPIVALYSSFLQRGYDQVMHEVCLQKSHVIFAIDRGGIVGADGATHNGVFDIAFLRTLPNIIIMAPKDGIELHDMLILAAEEKLASAIRFPRGKAAIFEGKHNTALELGKGQVLEDGKDAYILAYGAVSDMALNAIELLKKDNISVGLINMRFVKPLDGKLIRKLAAEHDFLVTVEENVVAGGAGSGVNEFLSSAGINIPTLNLGLPDRYIDHGSQESLLAECGLDATGIETSITNSPFFKMDDSLSTERKTAVK